MPSERDLADAFGVARGVVREGLAVLEAMRVVERRPNSGVYLRPVETHGSLEALVVQAGIGVPLTRSEVTEVVEMRRILELQAIGIACQRRAEADVARLDAVLAASEAALARGESLADLDADFHLAVVEATGNRVFLRLVRSFYLLSRERRARYFADGSQGAASHAQHREMRGAVADRDEARAVGLMGVHLKGVESHWFALLEGSGGGEREG